MSAESKVGVFVCHPAGGDAGPVDLQAVASWAAELPGVSSARMVRVGRMLDPLALRDEIRRGGLTAVVVAGYTPGYFKPAFTRAMAEAGGDPDEVRLASFREHGALAGQALERAKEVVACAVHGVPFGLAAETESVPVQPRHAGDRRRRRRHPGRAGDRRGGPPGLPGGAPGHHRRPHGDVRQDLPDARLRRLHPHAEDGGGRPAPQHRAHGAVRGPGGAGARRGLPGQGAAATPPASTPMPAWPATTARSSARWWCPASSTSASPPARPSTCRSRRRCPTPTSSTPSTAPGSRATARSAAPA